MKKLLIVFLSLTMLLAMAVPAFAYSDTSSCTAAQQSAIKNLTDLKIVGGYDDNTFRPNADITRAEFAKVAVNADVAYTGSEATTQMYFTFTDLTQGAWYDQWIQNACNRSLLKGYEDDTFRPNADITGNEAVTVVLRMMGYNDSNLSGTWPANYIAKAKEIGILNNVSLQNYNNAISRADVCVLVNNALQGKNITAADYAVVETTDSRTVTLVPFSGDKITCTLTQSDGAKANDLVKYTVDSQNNATLSKDGIVTNQSDMAPIFDNKITLNGKKYSFADNARIYEVTGENGKIDTKKLKVENALKKSYLKSAQTSKRNVDIQYVLDGSGNVSLMIIGGYSDSTAAQFGFLEAKGIHSSDIDGEGVRLFGDDTVYEVDTKNSSSTLSKNVLYQCRFNSKNQIQLNPVDTAKEQIQDGEITTFADGLYNVTGGTGSQNQFVITKNTVIIKAEYDKNGNVQDVTYNAEIKKGNTVDVRYNVKAEDDKEAAYVLIKTVK